MKYGGIFMSSKAAYINFLNSASISFGNKTPIKNPGYLTYFTSTGIIVGKQEMIKPVEYENSEELTDGMVEAHENSSLTLALIASSLFNHSAKKKDKNYSAIDQPALVLKDVQMLTDQNTIISIEQFILFTDQIIGVVPGKLDLDQF